MPGKVENWLVRLSDPAGVNETVKAAPFSAKEMSGLDGLLDLSLLHNVRPSVMVNLKSLLKHEPERLFDIEAAGGREKREEFLAKMEVGQLQDLGRSTLLERVANSVLKDVDDRNLPIVLVKGLDFAKNAYGGLRFRTFSDVDLLVDGQCYDKISEVLETQGFRELVPHKMRMEKAERQWIRSDQHDNNLLVEVHADMVHDPRLRKAMSLTYEDYVAPDLGGITPAGRLILASIHGAASHLFGRLQYVLDGLMIVRMGVEPSELEERAERSGCLLPLATTLRLSHALYGCEESLRLLGQLGKIPFDRAQQSLINPAMVLGAKGRNRWRFLPQRYCYRRLLRT